MQISPHDVAGRRCASAFGAAETRPPLLLFNGIGASIELASRLSTP